MIKVMFQFWKPPSIVTIEGCIFWLPTGIRGGGGGGGGGGGVTFAYGLNTPKMERGLNFVGKIDYKRS